MENGMAGNTMLSGMHASSGVVHFYDTILCQIFTSLQLPKLLLCYYYFMSALMPVSVLHRREREAQLYKLLFVGSKMFNIKYSSNVKLH
jgi:hypothetical protein